MIIDVHAHILPYYDIQQDKADCLRAMETYGIDKLYVSSVGAHVPDEAEVETLNREVADFVREHPKEIGGYVYLNPAHSNAMDVLRRGIEEQAMDGIKLWVATFCDDARVNPIAEKAIEYNIPVLLHAFHKARGQYCTETVGNNVAELALRYPELKIIMAHLGGNCYHGIPCIKHLPNVWVDHSGSIVRADDLRYTIKNIGADRVLFGTDLPGLVSGCIGQVLEAADGEDREKIFSKNALKLFDRSFRLEAAK